MQVLAAAAHDDLGEPRLVDGETVRVPIPDTLLALVDHGDLDAGALVCDHGAGRAADVPGADAANLGNIRRHRFLSPDSNALQRVYLYRTFLFTSKHKLM